LTTKLVITVVTRGDNLEHHVPGGFLYVDEMFAEAGLRDGLGASESNSMWQRMRVVRRGLQRELKRPVVLRVVNPWSPGGLWLVVRYRLRSFPCFLIGNDAYPLETSLEVLLEVVRRNLT
jgi:hypothetical protein